MYKFLCMKSLKGSTLPKLPSISKNTNFVKNSLLSVIFLCFKIYIRECDISMSYRYIDIFKYRTLYDILFYISIYFLAILYFTFVPFFIYYFPTQWVLTKNWKMRIFLSFVVFSMSSGNKCIIIRYMGNSELHEKLKINGF